LPDAYIIDAGQSANGAILIGTAPGELDRTGGRHGLIALCAA
jgi:hypothetical protein